MDSNGHTTDVHPTSSPPSKYHPPGEGENDLEVDAAEEITGDDQARELFNNEDESHESPEKINWSNEPSLLVEADQRGENDQDFVEYLPVEEEQMTISVKRIPVEPPKDDELWMLGLPATVSLERETFNKEESEKREEEAQLNATQLRVLKQSLTSCTIRSMSNGGAHPQSNTRLFQFSDGSSALIVARKQLEAGPREKDGLDMFLIEMSDNPICHIHGHLETKKLFSAPNVMELRGLMDNPLTSSVTTGGQASALKTRITTVQHGAESELRLKRHMEEQLIKELDSTNKAVKKKKTATLDANFLERDD